MAEPKVMQQIFVEWVFWWVFDKNLNKVRYFAERVLNGRSDQKIKTAFRTRSFRCNLLPSVKHDSSNSCCWLATAADETIGLDKQLMLWLNGSRAYTVVKPVNILVMHPVDAIHIPILQFISLLSVRFKCLQVRFTFGKIPNAFWTQVRIETNRTFRTFARTLNLTKNRHVARVNRAICRCKFRSMWSCAETIDMATLSDKVLVR